MHTGTPMKKPKQYVGEPISSLGHNAVAQIGVLGPIQDFHLPRRRVDLREKMGQIVLGENKPAGPPEKGIPGDH